MQRDAPAPARYQLVVQLGEGRGFPEPERAAAGDENGARVVCLAAVDGQARRAVSAAGDPVAPVWNCQLEWALSAAQLRALEAAGGGQCKLTFALEDGRRLGWVVLDLRSAKLAARHSRKAAWWAVAGPFKGRDSPEVRLLHTLVERPQQPERPPSAALHGAPAAHAAVAGAPLAQGPTTAAGLHLQPRAAHPPEQQQHWLAPGCADAQLLRQAGALSEALVADGSLRRFEFGVDLQHFQAGRRLPLNLASVVVQLSLPQELAGGPNGGPHGERGC